MSVTVIVAAIPPRVATTLPLALSSIAAQTQPPDRTIVVIDHDRLGPAATRNQGLRAVETEWVAFLDDDDEMQPQHLERLLAFAGETRADLVFAWFDMIGGDDPFPELFGKEFDRANPRSTTVTFLARTAAVRAVGGFPNSVCEELQLVIGLYDAGYVIRHLAERTWRWRHWGHGAPGVPGNTLGRPDRW